MSSTQETVPSDYFPIRVLSEKTGVNSITLRAWERRYGLLKPYRTEKGHRLYSDEDVELVQRILYWIDKGVSVGKVKSLLASDALNSELQDTIEDGWLEWQDAFLNAIQQGQQGKWEQMYFDATKQYPFSIVLRKGLLNVLQKIRNTPEYVAERFLLETSLVEMLVSLNSTDRFNKRAIGAGLILNSDCGALSARLLERELVSSEAGYRLIDGIKNASDVLELIQRFVPKQVIWIAESFSESEALKAIEQMQSYSPDIRVSLVGSGFWLAGNRMQGLDKLDLYSDLASYLN